MRVTAFAVFIFIATGVRARAEPVCEIRTDFPGGNLKIEETSEAGFRVAPDLRGGRDWFYWYFSAKAIRPGTVIFTFPEVVAKEKNGAIGLQGPAISIDQGKTWKWMGRDRVEGSTFSYEFKQAGEEARFSSALPYVEADFAAFMARNIDNPHLTQSVLTKSRKGRDVELIRIGEDSANVRPLLVTARQHANESVASYVVEGFLNAAMSEDTAGRSFRDRFVLYAVPFVDKDGVEDGDQGKNRPPHDHNRDWSDNPIHSEIVALKELDQSKSFPFAIDFHCPMLTLDAHQIMYFGGLKSPPARNLKLLTQFAALIKEELPPGAPLGPAVWAKDAPPKREPKHADYFGHKPDSVMVCTFEIPFAPPGREMNPPALREYGRAILDAWTRMDFAE